MTAGSHVLKVQADALMEVEENREGNNRLMKEYQVGG
jgi:subtilase family serine protease